MPESFVRELKRKGYSNAEIVAIGFVVIFITQKRPPFIPWRDNRNGKEFALEAFTLYEHARMDSQYCS